MPTRNVVLTEHHENVIDDLVKSGRYQNASEVLREGLRLVERRESLESGKLDVLKSLAATGFSDLEEGRFTSVADDDLEQFIAGLGRHARSSKKNV